MVLILGMQDRRLCVFGPRGPLCVEAVRLVIECNLAGLIDGPHLCNNVLLEARGFDVVVHPEILVGLAFGVGSERMGN